MKDLELLAAFVAVARTGSFTDAAEALGVSKATVSKRVAALEDQLGLPLFHRTTRHVAPTDAGGFLLGEAGPAIDALVLARAAVLDRQDEPVGTLRVSLPLAYGLTLAPVLVDLLEANPRLSLDVSFSDRVVDLLDEGFDLAVRIADLPDSSLRARRLGQMRRIVCASPAYLERFGAPARPQDLTQHRCLLYRYRQSGDQWVFPGHTGDIAVDVTGPVTADNGDALMALAAAGLGVAQLPDFIVQEALDDGRLVPLLEGYAEPPRTIWAVMPPGRHQSTKLRVVVDHLVEHLKPAATPR